MNGTLTLHALDWFHVTGHGDVAVIGSDDLPDGPANCSDLMGQDVDIDGRTYTVAGVEWCLVEHAGRCPLGYLFLVRPSIVSPETGRYTCCGTDALRTDVFHAAGCPNAPE